MLIVIVIIGILAAALIPRLSSARGRANDVARKADLAQVASALVSYQIDHGTLPDKIGSINCISGVLSTAGMSSIPTDPNRARIISGFINPTAGCTVEGNYYYFPVYKNWIPKAGFVLVAATETEWWSNYSTKQGNIDMSLAADATYENMISKMCTTTTWFIEWWAWSTPCDYTQANDNLRYIYVY